MSHSDRFGPELHPPVKEESTTSESRDSSDEKQWWVGKKLLVLSKEIGKSGKGTVVYLGIYNDEEVAVKRVLKSHLVDYNEIEILKKCGYHQNIASYKGDESDRDFRYLILELCLCNLYDVIQICLAPNQHTAQKKDLRCSMSSVTDRLETLKVILGDFKIYNEIKDRPSPLLLKLMRDMVSGLVYLHELGIIHRDFKPENILITKQGPTLCVKLSDMDISRCLAEDNSSLSNHHTGSGTMGWTAPEKLLSGRQTCKMDMFSLGCVLFFCITGGKRPFGVHDERNGNIKKDNKKNMYMIQDFPEAFHLISALLDHDPEKRPTAIEVLNDPMFGDADKKTSEDGGDQEKKTLKGASSLAKANGSAKVSQQLDFFESGKSSICRGSTSSDMSDESTYSSLSSNGSKPHKANDIRWEAIQAVRSKKGLLSFDCFRILKKLGCGDIGSVYLSELRGTKCYFVMKVMDERSLARRKKLPRARAEIEILQSVDHPFLLTLYEHFETEKYSCLVLEFCPGGDLHTLLQRQPGKHFTEQAVKFYVAEILLALEYLHLLGIVYRDLKPENVLVRDDGHIVLSNFDLSLRFAVSPTLLKSAMPESEALGKNPVCCVQPACIEPCIQPSCAVMCFGLSFFSSKSTRHRKPKNAVGNQVTPLSELIAEPTNARSMSFVGTHEYLAPEIITGEGHGNAVDWWAFGICLYELLFGKTPFKGQGNRATLFNIVGQPLRFPEAPDVSFSARDLIRGLLVKEPQHRLACKRGAAEIKQHPFFEGINWALIRCASPPEVPKPVEFERISTPVVSTSENAAGAGSAAYPDQNNYQEFNFF